MKMQKIKLIRAEEFERRLMKNRGFRREYKKLETEFQIASQILEARIKKNISQEELARKIKTGQAVISRLEGMNARPSISLLERVARALDIKFNIIIG